MKKLVKIDPITKRYTEIDTIRLKRETEALSNYIKNNTTPADDPYGIWKWVMPLCSGVLNETLVVPISYSDLPLKYPIREGLLSEDFEDFYAPFSITITGGSRKPHELVEINGELFTHVDFED